ncbi:hypothetical protein SCOCK_30298 [Actinacidiphila cocklensis]|uniref:Uncharacterized protein n=1 Tax=Actinacidiphila cocklensis TaxID=887465 RepID=A0A9W4DT28_9ACTN|nr:hypothetical protein SCOCK_30298 [Actinacidiphila cocklensis]
MVLRPRPPGRPRHRHRHPTRPRPRRQRLRRLHPELDHLDRRQHHRSTADRELLNRASTAGLRDGRLHDARHTAGIILLILGVPDTVVDAVKGGNPASPPACAAATST